MPIGLNETRTHSLQCPCFSKLTVLYGENHDKQHSLNSQ